ncbi:c-type cytochrome domain-containing protein [Tautonia plasticadhaerens]|uniref:WD domain, G-beta repeat n=1 Tax=Tautonia plasticadhaerens TaxID=2527974 RepID=A0A518H2U5_9BACT|nr:c-type cytochrome domain-containing protein [Tautonia plasticadhaerens]QDV35162.1 WD domain, G-beta repeat [Tautonia plasticadhaerens]
MLNRPTLAALLATTLAAPAVALAQGGPIEVAVPDREGPVSFWNEVIDILDNRCIGCHNVALAENGLNMEEIAFMIEGGDSGPAIVPGKADESLLFKMAAHRVEPFMPPVGDDLEPMTPDELGLLKLWIDQGAKDDPAEMTEEPADSPAIELGELPPGVNPVLAVDLTADGGEVAIGRANVVQVYDTRSGLEVVRLGGHQDLIQSVRFSADGSRLAAGSYRVATVWDAPTRTLEKTLDGLGAKVNALASTIDGSTIVSGGEDGSIRVWDGADAAQRRQMDQPEKAPVRSLALSSDGSVAASGSPDGVVRLWKVEDGSSIGEWKGHEGAVRALAFVGPGTTRLATAGDDGRARLWTLHEGPAAPAEDAQPIELDGHDGAVLAIASAPDGSTVITGGDDGSVRVWEAEDGSATRTIEAHSGPVRALAISPDGQSVLSGSDDGTARLWSMADGSAGPELVGHEGGVRAVAFSPSGDRVATSGATGLKVWEAGTGTGVAAFGHVAADDPAKVAAVDALAFAGDGRVVSGAEDQAIKLWGVSGKWSLHRTLGPHAFRVLAIDFSPDGSLIATGGGEPAGSGEVKLWDAESGELRLDLPELHSDTVFGLRFRPDGSALASAAADKFVKVVAVPSWELVETFEGHTHHVLSVDWNADGTRLVSGGADTVLKFWDYEKGEQLRTSQEAGNQVTSVRWIPGKEEVLGASGDTTVRLWNAENGRAQRSYAGATDYVHGVATSADGSIVAAGDDTGTLFLWKVGDGVLIRKIEPPADDRPGPGVAAGG